MNKILYYTAIILACIWILFYGSVYETQYYDFIYLYGDELLVILSLVVLTVITIEKDFVLGLLLFLIIFFITNDVSIIHNALDVSKHKEEFQLPKSTNGVNQFINSVSKMNMLEENMEGLLGSLNVKLNKSRYVSL